MYEVLMINISVDVSCPNPSLIKTVDYWPYSAKYAHIDATDLHFVLNTCKFENVA